MQTIQRFIYSFIRARCYRCDEWFLVVRSRSLASWPTTRWMSVWKHRPRDAHGGLRQQGTSGLRKRLDPAEACLSGTDRPTDSVMRCDAMRGGSLVGRGAAPGPHRGLLGQSREERTKPTSRPDMSGCTSSCTVLYNGTVQCLQYCRRGERDHETCPLYE